LSNPSFTAGGANYNVPSGGSLTLAQGSYGVVTLNNSSTLKLTSGEYFFTELRYLSSSVKYGTIQIDLSSGNPVTINVESDFQLGHDAAFRLLPNGESDSKLVMVNLKQSSKISLGREAYLLGSFNAPNAKLTLEKLGQLRGTICAKEILVERDCLFLHHDSPGTLPGPDNMHKTSASDGEDDEDEASSDQSPVTSYQLEQNYPNPFNPSTAIRFGLVERGNVQVSVYNEAGQLVRVLAEEDMSAGLHELAWDGRNHSGAIAASGVYFYRLSVRNPNGATIFSQTRRMTFLK